MSANKNNVQEVSAQLDFLIADTINWANNYWQRLDALEEKLSAKAGFNPSQPRVPAGNPDGGQWTDPGGG